MGKRSRTEDSESLDGTNYSELNMSSPTKITELDIDTSSPVRQTKMQCSLPPHRPVVFASAEEFDVHYVKEHSNRCCSCGKNFPSAHYLSLHIDEHHNPVREELASKGEKTYACFVEDCEKKCSTPQKRRLHLIDKHMFPKAYNFRITDHGIDKSTSMLQGGQRRRLSTSNPAVHRRKSMQHAVGTAMISEDGLPTSTETASARLVSSVRSTGDEIGELEKSFAALKFVPPSVQAKHRNMKSAK